MAYRATKKMGGLRVTASKSGLSASVGVPGLRVGVNTKGQLRRKVGIPGTGIYSTRTTTARGKATASQATSGREDGHGRSLSRVRVTALDGARGRRDLLSTDQAVSGCKVVGVTGRFQELADLAGITPRSGGFSRAIRLCLVSPEGDDWAVIVMIEPQDNPALFRRGDTTPKAFPFGRVSRPAIRQWEPLLARRAFLAAIYVDATLGMERAEIRFFGDALADEGAQVDIGSDLGCDSHHYVHGARLASGLQDIVCTECLARPGPDEAVVPERMTKEERWRLADVEPFAQAIAEDEAATENLIVGSMIAGVIVIVVVLILIIANV